MANFMDKIKDFIAGPYDEDDYDEYDYDDYEEEEEEEYHAPSRSLTKTRRENTRDREAIQEYSAPKTTAKRSQPQVVDFGTARTSTNDNHVVIIKPDSYEAAKKVTDQMKLRRPVVVNLEKLEFPIAQRVMDFLSGTCYALEGELQRVSKNIFIIAPVNYDIETETDEEPKITRSNTPSWMNFGGK